MRPEKFAKLMRRKYGSVYNSNHIISRITSDIFFDSSIILSLLDMELHEEVQHYLHIHIIEYIREHEQELMFNLL